MLPIPAQSSPRISDFAYAARCHLTVVLGRVQLLRRDAARSRTDLDACVGRLDDIEFSIRRLEQLINDLERPDPPR